MTIREQIYIEDKYRRVIEDINLLINEEPSYEVADYEEVEDFLDELQNLKTIQFFIENFVKFSNYHFRETESGWTLFENEDND